MSLPQQQARAGDFHPKGDHPLDDFCNFSIFKRNESSKKFIFYYRVSEENMYSY